VSDANDSPRNDTYDVCGRHCRCVSAANYWKFQLNKHTTRENNNIMTYLQRNKNNQQKIVNQRHNTVLSIARVARVLCRVYYRVLGRLHFTLLVKLGCMDIPDNILTWLLNFYLDDSLRTCCNMSTYWSPCLQWSSQSSPVCPASITPLKQPYCVIHDHLINAIGSQNASLIFLLLSTPLTITP